MRAFFAVCALIFSANAFAATVAVSLVQNADAPHFAYRMTRVVEDQLMDEFFASGEVVSNMRIIEGGPLSDRDRELNIREAARGRANYLLSVYLQYDPSEKHVDSSGNTYPILKAAEWQLIDVLSSKILGGGAISPEEDRIRKEGVQGLALGIARPICEESLRIKGEARR